MLVFFCVVLCCVLLYCVLPWAYPLYKESYEMFRGIQFQTLILDRQRPEGPTRETDNNLLLIAGPSGNALHSGDN